MTPHDRAIMDGNQAAASVAYRLSEVAAIYPITPASPMGEHCDEWSAQGRTNLWGDVVSVMEMQSEGGAAGAVHGALQAGALATTFTASQGLLLMVPDMYKIAGELTPFVMHVAARTVATHALSIFGDHSDVMACRPTGFAHLCSTSVQEAHDMAAVAHAATLESRIPFLHFFDGFRTSHEIKGILTLSDEQLAALVDERSVQAHRDRRLTPDRPVLRGSAQNPDTFFQAREAANRFHADCPARVAGILERFAGIAGRRYELFEYTGHPAAERIVVLMGSGAQTAAAVARRLAAEGEAVGVLNVRLYRPFSVEHMLASLPRTTRSIAVLDRTKEPGSVGEPLYCDVVAALHEGVASGFWSADAMPRVIGGRYGLSSKEFTPAMVASVFAELSRPTPRPHFTVGIVDDVTHLSLDVDESFHIEPGGTVSAVFYGLGSDGTVGANKNSIKIIGTGTDKHVQAYFVYDSKKSGGLTISHLRFGPEAFETPYLVRDADFVGCHQFEFLERYDVLECAADGAVLLLNAPYDPAEVWAHLPYEVQEGLLAKGMTLYVIDAAAVAEKAGMGRRINTVMQTCFFALSGVLDRGEAVDMIKDAIGRTYARKGDQVVRRNHAAVDTALAHLHEVTLPDAATATDHRRPIVSERAPDFVQRVTAVMMAGHGDRLPVSALPVDGTWPTDTARWEKRDIADTIPVWDPDVCIQCNKCAEVCPHAAIRAKAFAPEALAAAPASFLSREWRDPAMPDLRFTIQVAPDDCTGCGLCVHVCPAKDRSNPRHKAIDMVPQRPVLDRERERFDFFLGLPELAPTDLPRLDVRHTQLLRPLFEYSGACAGCGETPYIKLLTQLYGDRLLIANATGCSSIYGGNLPTTPYAQDGNGRGPAWANSLFEDNAEFGLGMRLAVDARTATARRLLRELASPLGDTLVDGLLTADQTTHAGIAAQRERVALLGSRLAQIDTPSARRLQHLADDLVDKSIWLIGGDGWAYDIGYGGLDHVLGSGRNVNVLVLDTEVYSNTGGQASKATPLGAAAKFASQGKATPKKDLGLMALGYGDVYVASVAMGARDSQVLAALGEADSYAGPALIIAYSHCIAHGYDMSYGMDQQKRAVDSGVWPLYRHDPRRVDRGESALVVDAPGDRIPVEQYMRNETRFRVVEKIDPAGFKRYARRAQSRAERRVAIYRHMAALRFPVGPPPPEGDDAPRDDDAGTDAPAR